MLSVRKASAILAVLAGCTSAPLAQAQTKITIGTVKSLGAIASYIAEDKGYFKEQGLQVDLVMMNSTANAVGVFAKGDLNILEGGIAVGFFNAVAKKLPMIIASDRVSSPIMHRLLVGTQHKGKITKITDLKGKSIGNVATGAVTTYELGKMLASAGMGLSDVQLKAVPFPQMGIALKNGAIEAALVIEPFTTRFEQQGLGYSVANADDLVQPSPMTISVAILNTDWAAKNKEVVRKFFVAYLRATRDYCLAYHRGPNRPEIVAIAVKNGLVANAAAMEKTPWTGRNLDGRVNVPSLMDMQKFYVANKLMKTIVPGEKLYTSEYIDHANKVLGPLPAIPASSNAPGCR